MNDCPENLTVVAIESRSVPGLNRGLISDQAVAVLRRKRRGTGLAERIPDRPEVAGQVQVAQCRRKLRRRRRWGGEEVVEGRDGIGAEESLVVAHCLGF